MEKARQAKIGSCKQNWYILIHVNMSFHSYTYTFLLYLIIWIFRRLFAKLLSIEIIFKNVFIINLKKYNFKVLILLHTIFWDDQVQLCGKCHIGQDTEKPFPLTKSLDPIKLLKHVINEVLPANIHAFIDFLNFPSPNTM